jgi:site-specific DNA recombinase
MTATAMYLRQSKDTEDNQLAITRQREACLKLCQEKGWGNIVEYCDNDRSASNGKPRPAYQRMLADIKAGKISAVVCWHQDRLHRDVAELLVFAGIAVERNLKLATVSGDIDLASDDGEFMAIVQAAVARKEVRLKSARQKSANLQRATNGGRPWWPARPFGYDADADPLTGKWITTLPEVDPDTGKVIKRQQAIRLHPKEAKLLRTAYANFNSGTALYEIADRWNKAGVRTPCAGRKFKRRGVDGEYEEREAGGKWSGSRVRELLPLGRNAGLREYGGQVVGTGDWPAIVSEGTWRLARVKINSKRTTGPYRGRKHLLSGIARCGLCDGLFTSHVSARGKRQYACNTEGCRRVSRDAVKLDELIIAAVVARLTREDAALLLQPDEPVADTDTLREQRRALEDRLVQLGKDFANAPPAFTQAAVADIQGKLDDINNQLEDPGKVNVYEDVIGADDVAKAFAGLDLGRRRTIVDALMVITVNPVGRSTGGVWDPDAIVNGKRAVDVVWREDL